MEHFVRNLLYTSLLGYPWELQRKTPKTRCQPALVLHHGRERKPLFLGSWAADHHTVPRFGDAATLLHYYSRPKGWVCCLFKQLTTAPVSFRRCGDPTPRPPPIIIVKCDCSTPNTTGSPLSCPTRSRLPAMRSSATHGTPMPTMRSCSRISSCPAAKGALCPPQD